MTKLLLQALSYVDEVTVPESNERGEGPNYKHWSGLMFRVKLG
jgi:hypothetical protein